MCCRGCVVRAHDNFPHILSTPYQSPPFIMRFNRRLNQVNSEERAAEQTCAWNACNIMHAQEAREARAKPHPLTAVRTPAALLHCQLWHIPSELTVLFVDNMHIRRYGIRVLGKSCQFNLKMAHM